MPTRGSVAPARQTVEGGHHLLSTSSRTGWSSTPRHQRGGRRSCFAPNRARAADVAALAVQSRFRPRSVGSTAHKLGTGRPGHGASRERGAPASDRVCVAAVSG
jgi:hypothetical protein